jgi:hypothetical protein
VKTGDGAYPQLLLLAEWSHAAAEKIHRAIVRGTPGEKRLVPILRPYDPIGSTDDVWFETTKTCFDTTKSHINRVPQDSGWETELAQKLELMPEVVGFAKNQGLNLKIPYSYEGRAANYVPDFLIRLDRFTGEDDLLTWSSRSSVRRRSKSRRRWPPPRPLDPRGQPLGRFRPLGVPRGDAHGERRRPDPLEVPRRTRSAGMTSSSGVDRLGRLDLVNDVDPRVVKVRNLEVHAQELASPALRCGQGPSERREVGAADHGDPGIVFAPVVDDVAPDVWIGRRVLRQTKQRRYGNAVVELAPRDCGAIFDDLEILTLLIGRARQEFEPVEGDADLASILELHMQAPRVHAHGGGARPHQPSVTG